MKTFKITKEQILQLNRSAENKINQLVSVDLKAWFPEAFKTELEVGKWYKINNDKNYLMNYQGVKSAYGFYDGRFRGTLIYDVYHQDRSTLATEEEVKTALIEEAKRRGFKSGNYKCLSLDGRTYNHSDDYEICFSKKKLFTGWVNNSRNIIFDNGKWAEIIPQVTELTLEQIADKFNIDVKQLKIKK